MKTLSIDKQTGSLLARLAQKSGQTETEVLQLAVRQMAQALGVSEAERPVPEVVKPAAPIERNLSQSQIDNARDLVSKFTLGRDQTQERDRS